MSLTRRIWISTTVVILLVGGYLFFYNRPIELQKAVLMTTPIMFQDGSVKPYATLPADVDAPFVKVFYATDRQRPETVTAILLKAPGSAPIFY